MIPLLLLVVAVFLAGLGLWAVIRTPPQLLWGQPLVGKVNGFNNWMFDDAAGSAPSPGGKILLRLMGTVVLVAAIVVSVVAIKLL